MHRGAIDAGNRPGSPTADPSAAIGTHDAPSSGRSSDSPPEGVINSDDRSGSGVLTSPALRVIVSPLG